MSAGRYWMRLSRFFMTAASWGWCAAGAEIAQAVLHVRPRTLDGVEVRGISRQPRLGQPVRVRVDEDAHRGADVGVQVIPDQNHGGMQLVVRGGDQAGVVGFGHRAALTLAAAVDAGPVEQAAALTGPVAGQPRDRDPAGALAGHLDHGSVAAGCPGAGLGRAQVLPGLVLEADIRPGRRR